MKIIRFNAVDWFPYESCVLIFNSKCHPYVSEKDNRSYYTICGRKLNIKESFEDGKVYVVVCPNTNNP